MPLVPLPHGQTKERERAGLLMTAGYCRQLYLSFLCLLHYAGLRHFDKDQQGTIHSAQLRHLLTTLGV